MQTVARAAAKLAPPAVAAGAAAAAASSSGTHVAHADAVVDHRVLPRRLDDWELIESSGAGSKTILFSAADVDAALAELARPLPPPARASAVVIEEESEEPSSDTSVDALIERSSHSADASAGAALGLDSELLTVAARLLRSPGVQQEICAAALADPEVFSILASKMDLQDYLEGQGFAARGLLAGGDRPQHGSSVTVVEEAGAAGGLLGGVSGWAADRLEDLGWAVLRLGRWLRDQVDGGARPQQATEHSSGRTGRHQPGAPARRVGALTAVVAACVAIVSVVLLNNPRQLRRLLQQRVAPATVRR